VKQKSFEPGISRCSSPRRSLRREARICSSIHFYSFEQTWSAWHDRDRHATLQFTRARCSDHRSHRRVAPRRRDASKGRLMPIAKSGSFPFEIQHIWDITEGESCQTKLNIDRLGQLNWIRTWFKSVKRLAWKRRNYRAGMYLEIFYFSFISIVLSLKLGTIDLSLSS